MVNGRFKRYIERVRKQFSGITMDEEMSDSKVILYALSTCSHCKAVKSMLDRYDVEAEVIDVDRLDKDRRSEVLKNVRKVNERMSFPTLVVGEDVVVGDKTDRIKSILEKNHLR
jgi:glutaredoxin-like protein NrdH